MIKKVVLTGGPCTGKTTVLNDIKDYYRDNGFKVIVVPETATELIKEGIKCFGEDKLLSVLDYQEIVLRLQLQKESIVDYVLKMHSNDDILVIYDRGALDGEAYVNQSDFQSVIKRVDPNMTSDDLLKRYDMVLVLIGDSSFYTLETNSARRESAAEALELGKKTLMSWIEHDNLKLVYPKETMEEKSNEVIKNIANLFAQGSKKEVNYVVDLDNSNLNEIFSSARVRNYQESEILQSIHFISDKRAGCLNIYRDTNLAMLKLDTSINDLPTLSENLCVEEEIKNMCLELKGVK